MHKYLRSIGFSNIHGDKDAEFFLNLAVSDRFRAGTFTDESGIVFEEYRLRVGSSMGICIVGHRDKDGKFYRNYYFPYMKSHESTLTEEGAVERHAEKETYAGILDDFRAGITLIFYLCNSLEMREFEQQGLDVGVKKAYITGLSVEGKVLLPAEKAEEDEESANRRYREQKALYEAARNGDEDAIETLTETDMNLMSEAAQRIETEDLYSIVESSFMPAGIECDIYQILGEITAIRARLNAFTHETVLDLRINCNDAIFHVCINKADLEGVPTVGRRFKGRVWMQGDIEFSKYSASKNENEALDSD